jgi:hypothetical protein
MYRKKHCIFRVLCYQWLQVSSGFLECIPHGQRRLLYSLGHLVGISTSTNPKLNSQTLIFLPHITSGLPTVFFSVYRNSFLLLAQDTTLGVFISFTSYTWSVRITCWFYQKIYPEIIDFSPSVPPLCLNYYHFSEPLQWPPDLFPNFRPFFFTNCLKHSSQITSSPIVPLLCLQQSLQCFSSESE